MPVFEYFGDLGVGVDFSDEVAFLFVEVDESHPRSDTEFFYRTADGGLVRVEGTGFGFDASATPTEGSISALYFDFDGDGVEDASLTDVIADVSNLLKGFQAFVDQILTRPASWLSMRGSDHDDLLVTNDSGVYYLPNAGNDIVLGGTGNDSIQLAEGSDLVDLGAGNDILYFGTDAFDEADTIIGGAGSDALSFRSGSLWGIDFDLATQTLANAPVATEFSGFETVYGTNGDDTLRGDDAANLLHGWLGDDLLLGGEGDDTLIGGGGIDTVDGGAGADVARIPVLWSSIGWTTEDGLTWVATIAGDSPPSHVTLTDIEMVTLNAPTMTVSFGRNGFGAVATVFDDGVRVARTSVDDGGLWDWATRLETYNSDGDRTGIVTTFDNGDVQSVDLDPATQQFTSLVYEDLSERAPWAQYEDTYSAGVLATRLMTEDDGDTIYSEFSGSVRTQAIWEDVSDSTTYETLRDNFDLATGKRINRRYDMDGGDVVSFRYTDGVITRRGLIDGDGSHPWENYTNEYDAAGVLFRRTIEMDDNDMQVSLYTDGVLSEVTFYDNGGTEEAYDRLILRYADDGVTLTEQAQTLDNGDVWTTRYRDDGTRDVFILEDDDGSDAWDTRVDYYLEDGTTIDYRLYVYPDGSETFEFF